MPHQLTTSVSLSALDRSLSPALLVSFVLTGRIFVKSTSRAHRRRQQAITSDRFTAWSWHLIRCIPSQRSTCSLSDDIHNVHQRSIVSIVQFHCFRVSSFVLAYQLQSMTISMQCTVHCSRLSAACSPLRHEWSPDFVSVYCLKSRRPITRCREGVSLPSLRLHRLVFPLLDHCHFEICLLGSRVYFAVFVLNLAATRHSVCAIPPVVLHLCDTSCRTPFVCVSSRCVNIAKKPDHFIGFVFDCHDISSSSRSSSWSHHHHHHHHHHHSIIVVIVIVTDNIIIMSSSLWWSSSLSSSFSSLSSPVTASSYRHRRRMWHLHRCLHQFHHRCQQNGQYPFWQSRYCIKGCYSVRLFGYLPFLETTCVTFIVICTCSPTLITISLTKRGKCDALLRSHTYHHHYYHHIWCISVVFVSSWCVLYCVLS